MHHYISAVELARLCCLAGFAHKFIIKAGRLIAVMPIGNKYFFIPVNFSRLTIKSGSWIGHNLFFLPVQIQNPAEVYSGICF